MKNYRLLSQDLRDFRKEFNLNSTNTLTFTSPKILKNEKVSKAPTAVLYLKPSKTACSSAGSCMAMCLNTAGNPAYLKGKLACRSRRDYALRTNKDLFLRNLVIELFKFYSKNRSFKNVSGRLNGVSDHNWLTIEINLTDYDSKYILQNFDIAIPAFKYTNIFELFNNAYDCFKSQQVSKIFSFYDYSKHVHLNFDYAKRLGYHLSLSAGSKYNTLEACIKHNLNYAGVFNIKKNTPCPKFVTINGRKFPTIDGDLTDWRIGDPSHTTHVIVLRVKRTPNQTEDMRKAFCVDELEKIRVATDLKREYEAKISQGIFARPALIPA